MLQTSVTFITSRFPVIRNHFPFSPIPNSPSPLLKTQVHYPIIFLIPAFYHILEQLIHLSSFTLCYVYVSEESHFSPFSIFLNHFKMSWITLFVEGLFFLATSYFIFITLPITVTFLYLFILNTFIPLCFSTFTSHHSK